jgi:hypothetical protein
MKMTTFQEFLEKHAEQQRSREKRERREEWIAAAGRLVKQIRAWLAESDPKQVLEVLAFDVQRSEPDLGTYTIPSLKIGLGDASVRVEPVGRNAMGIIGARAGSGLGAAGWSGSGLGTEGGVAAQVPVGARAEGRVDLTDGIRRYILYRTLMDGQENWYALDERFQPAPLDRGRLEAMLLDLLS